MARSDYKTKIVCSAEHPTGIEVALTEAEIDQRVADEERVKARDIERAKVQYRRDRAEKSNGYSAIGEQLDQLFWDIDSGKLDKTGEFYKSIKAVKDAHPKPE